MRARVALLLAAIVGCGAGSVSPDGGNGGGDGDGDGDGDGGDGDGDGGSSSAPQFTELWYSVDDRLVRIEISTADGSVAGLTESTLSTVPPLGQNSLTMLDDGSLIGARLSDSDNRTYFYAIAEPPRDGSAAQVEELGVMPDDVMLEALYTDCDGRLYGMDTGSDDTNADGNRLVRFTGDVTAGNFGFDVVSDLSSADVADIDDMGPGISAGQITDNPGFAIDTGHIHDFNYDTGSGTEVGSGGTYGVHVLGGPLFDDDTARLYVFSSSAQLFEMHPTTFELSSELVTGPSDVEGDAGWSGLAGPLTDCESGFAVD